MVEAGSTTSTWRLCGLSSLGKFSLGFTSAKLPMEDKSHNLRVDVVDPILLIRAAHFRFSHRILWLEMSVTNNDPSVIVGYYLQVVESFKGMLTDDQHTEISSLVFIKIKDYSKRQKNRELSSCWDASIFEKRWPG